MLSLLLPLAILTAPPGPSILCIYGEELYAKTTVEQEFADSAWVGRVRVLSGEDHWPADDSDDEPWTLYRAQVVETFKGTSGPELAVFTHRNSGGFYMDRLAQGADIGGEYLLFLNPVDAAHVPAETRGAMVVNYSCGQSRWWNEVSAADRGTLVRLEAE